MRSVVVSSHSLRPRDTEALASLCAAVFDTSMDKQDSVRRMGKDMELWAVYCQEMGTDPWRPDAASLTPLEKLREVTLDCGFLHHMRFYYSTPSHARQG